MQRHLITNRRRWQPPLIPESPPLPPSGLPPKQHPAAEPEEDHEEEESPHPGQLDHHPGAAGSRLKVTRREENLQPSALCDHGVMWRQRGGGETKTWNNSAENCCWADGGNKEYDVKGAAGVRCFSFSACAGLDPEQDSGQSKSEIPDLWGPHERIGRWRLNLSLRAASFNLTFWNFQPGLLWSGVTSTHSDDWPGKDLSSQ